MTSKGSFVIQVTRDWAPHGADRFYNLVNAGFYNDARFFRVIDGFMVQFGISGNPDVSAAWTNATIPDDPVRESNSRGTVTPRGILARNWLSQMTIPLWGKVSGRGARLLAVTPKKLISVPLASGYG